MKEHPLDFHNDQNPTPVTLSQTNKKEAVKTAMDLSMAAGEIVRGLKENRLEKGFCNK